MPRVNVTDEELKHLEELRRKQAHTLGYNEGLEVAILQIKARVAPEGTELSGDPLTIVNALRALKRDLA